MTAPVSYSKLPDITTILNKNKKKKPIMAWALSVPLVSPIIIIIRLITTKTKNRVKIIYYPFYAIPNTDSTPYNSPTTPIKLSSPHIAISDVDQAHVFASPVAL